jgi:hypothetical protein
MMSGVSSLMGSLASTAMSGLGPDYALVNAISPSAAKYYGYATNPGGMALFQNGGPMSLFGGGSQQQQTAAPFHSQSGAAAPAPASGGGSLAFAQPSAKSQSPQLSGSQQPSMGLFGK